MKRFILVAAILVAWSVELGGQQAAPEPGAAATATTAPTSAPAAPNHADEMKNYERVCKQRAIHQAAYEFCHDFAVVLAGEDTATHDALKSIANLTPDAAGLANAYSIYKTNSIASEADQQAEQAAVNAANKLKTDVGAPVAGSGSTSLIAKPVATQLVAVALESGALTQSQNGNTITLQTNLDHLFREAFLGAPELSYFPKGTPVLQNMSLSAGLATNSASTMSVPTTGSANTAPVNTANVLFNSSATKLSTLTVNYEFNNKLTQRYLTNYLKKHNLQHLYVPPDKTTSPAVDKARAAFISHFSSYQPTAECQAQAYLGLAQATASAEDRIAQFIARFNGCFDTAAGSLDKTDSTLDSDWAAYTQAFQADLMTFQKSLQSQMPGWDASAQYVFNQPVGQPETHDFRFVGSGDLSNAAGSTWNLNAAVSIYGSIPAGAEYGRLKDAQVSGELDKNLGSARNSPSFSLAGYGQYQSKPSVLNITASSVPSGVTLPANAQVFVAGTQGWLEVVQAKITVHIGGAAIPLAGKWSNKTELLDKSKFGGQFGVSYDFSQLKQLIGLGSSTN
ncbi:MAG: hypothetical protein ABSF28_02725 [Terracidiphilus sp.]|jgi:hypothetical protein